MQAPPAGNLDAIRSPERIRERRALEYPRSANAAVGGHACYRHWPSQFSPTHQHSRHKYSSDDLRPYGSRENDQWECDILLGRLICETTQFYTLLGKDTLLAPPSSQRSMAGRNDSPAGSM